jgi:hypothetical protein
VVLLGWITGAKALDVTFNSSRPQPPAFSNAQYMLDQLLRLAGALDELARAPRRTGTRTEDDRLTMDPGEVRAITEKREREALETIRDVLHRIGEWRGELAMTVPAIPEYALRRAAELGVDLPKPPRGA